MEFKLFELEKMFNDINDIINYMETSQYQNRRFRLFLANGDRVNFQVPNESIAHLLGVKTDYLISTGLFKSTNSFQLLKEMCSNAYRINKAHQEKIINYDFLFSKFIQRKIEYFKKNIYMDLYSTEVVCKYNPQRSYLNYELSEKYDYIIIKIFENGEVGILGIVKNNKTYSPVTNQVFDSLEAAEEALRKFLSNQEITILNGINVSNVDTDFNKTLNLNLSTKERKISNLLSYKDKFNCSIDVSGDYKYSINRLMQDEANRIANQNLIDLIVDSIRNGNIIDTQITRDTDLIKIIESFNDYLCHKHSNADEIDKSYTSLKSDLEYFKTLCEELQAQIDKQADENKALNDEVTRLNEENSAHQNARARILEILTIE